MSGGCLPADGAGGPNDPAAVGTTGGRVRQALDGGTTPDGGATGDDGPRSFRIAVLASGSGTNLQAIIDKLHGRTVEPEATAGRAGSAGSDGVTAGALTAKGAAGSAGAARWDGAPAGAPPGGGRQTRRIDVVLVVSDVPGARALERARQAGIPAVLCSRLDSGSRAEHESAVLAAVTAAAPDLVVLAGYMRIVPSDFVRAFPWRVINLHPALLPAFPGTTSISDAVKHGVKVTGVTVHFVDEGLDTGPIIAQEPVRVEEGDTAESLAARIHQVEHELLPATIRLIATGRVRSPLSGSRVVQVDWGGADGLDSRAE